MSESTGGNTIVHCPKCRKEYSLEEYDKLKRVKSVPIASIRGKSAPKEALEEIAQRTGGVLYKEHIDIFGDNVYDPKICSVCGTEFGFVKIVGKDKGNTIYRIDLDLVEPKNIDK